MTKRIYSTKAQSIIEYGIIIALVSTALATMQVYIKRGMQAQLKVSADQLGTQQDALEVDGIDGFTLYSYTPTNTVKNQGAYYLSENISPTIAVAKSRNEISDTINAVSIRLVSEEEAMDGEFPLGSLSE